MIVGITGNSGAGKSEVTKLLAKKLKADIVDADKIARKLAEPGHEYYKKILEIFGKTILLENSLNRQKIAEIIYNDNRKREQLNKLTYKYIGNEIKTKIQERNTYNGNVIIDVPLLFESGLYEICDYTVAVLADKQKKIERICKRDKLDKEIAEARLNIQATDEFYKKRADYIIFNNKKVEDIDLEELCTKIGKN